MKAILLFIFLTALIQAKETSDKFKHTKKYTFNDIINLIKLNNTKDYFIIDPDNYIEKEDEKNLEDQLIQIYKGHRVIPILIMAHNFDLVIDGKNIGISNFTEKIIDEIKEKKIIKDKFPIIIAVISIEDKIMTMKAEGSISYTITQQDCYNILDIVNNYFSYGKFSDGAVELGRLINYYLVNTGFFSRNKRFFIMIIILIFCFCLCYFLAFCAQKIRDRRNLRLTMSDEQKLLKIREFLKKTRADKKILCENCIICLDSFDNCKSVNHSLIEDNEKKDMILIKENKDNNEVLSNNDVNIEMQNVSTYNLDKKSEMTDTQISTLPCGHRYHVKCITEWMLKKKGICPMCREKINVDIPEMNEEDDIQNELLNIQIELHPAFALLVFNTINQELTWGAMALPAINGGLFAGLGGFALI